MRHKITATHKRVDDLPAIIAHRKNMRVAAFLETHFPTNGHGAQPIGVPAVGASAPRAHRAPGPRIGGRHAATPGASLTPGPPVPGHASRPGGVSTTGQAAGAASTPRRRQPR